MTQADPLVSINIVTRNRRVALGKAIESAYAQTHRNLEIVVVDNDSSDGSPDMVAQRWPEVILIKLHHNIGCQPGRNIGMKNCSGKYIFNLDDDGALEPNAISLIVKRFEAEPDIAVVAASIAPMNEDRANLVIHKRYESPRYVACFPGGASAIRTSILDDAGYFPEYPRGHAEADLALRILDKRYEMVFIPDAVMYHDVSDIERNSNVIRFYSVWHHLETRLRLEPWCRCLLNSVWKTSVDFIVSLRDGTFPGYIAGVCRFIYEIPRIFSERRPVSARAVQKFNYLTYHYITDGDVSRSFKKFTLLQALRRRLRKKHLQLSPDNTPEG